MSQIIVSEDAGYQKPHKGFFQYAFNLCEIQDKNEVIIVGDSLSADIKGGKDFGIATCWYNPTGTTNDSIILII
jgi:2-haloacid dehalogenase